MTCECASTKGNTRQRPAPARRRGRGRRNTRHTELFHMEISTLALIDVAK
jgi:hypothetical protein